MQPKTVSHVDAVFGGRRLRFELQRDIHSLLDLENDLGSIRGCLGRFLDNTWRVSDVLTILARAHPAPVQRADAPADPLRTVAGLDQASNALRRAAGLPERHTAPAPPAPPAGSRPGVNPGMLNRILSAAPPTVYAILAARILEALLYGIEPARAEWDEKNPTGEASAAEEAAA